MSTNDDFIKKLGPLELQARMRSTEKVNVAQYLDFLQDQALEWSNAEKKSVNDLFLSIKNRLKTLNLKLDLPEKINLVKTNGFEEPRTAYTRGQSIILPPFLVNKTKNNPIGAEFLLVHELFHIISRYKPQIRAPLYHLVGYENCQVAWPSDLRQSVITNPDEPNDNWCISLTDNGGQRFFTPILVSTVGPEKGYMSDSNAYLVGLELKGNVYQPFYRNDKLVTQELSPSNEEYMNKTGGNTYYLTHPEEIIANNFAFAVMESQGIPNEKLLNDILSLFRR